MGPACLTDLVGGVDIETLAGAQSSDEVLSQRASARLLGLLLIEPAQALLGAEHDEVAEIDLHAAAAQRLQRLADAGGLGDRVATVSGGHATNEARWRSPVQQRGPGITHQLRGCVAVAPHRPRCGEAAPRPRANPAYTARAMPKVCHVCNKGPAFGQSRSHSMVATKRRFDPNLQRVRVDLGGTPKRVYVCTRCLKAGKVTKA